MVVVASARKWVAKVAAAVETRYETDRRKKTGEEEKERFFVVV
jgi:hypothetical protein